MRNTRDETRMPWPVVAVILLAIAVFLAKFIVMSPNGSEPVERYEGTAIATLLRVNEVESRHLRVSGTFTCSPAEIREAYREAKGRWRWVDRLLDTNRETYTIAFETCFPASGTGQAGYRLTAVPIKSEKVSGVRAFCTDQSGTIFYADDGTLERCIRERKVLMSRSSQSDATAR